MQRRLSSIIRRTCVRSGLLVTGIVMLTGCEFSFGTSATPTPHSSFTTPLPFASPTAITEPNPNSNGAMDRANLHGAGVYVTNAVLQFHSVEWKRKLGSGPTGLGVGTIYGR